MKNRLLILTAALLAAGCGKVDGTYYERTPSTSGEGGSYTPVDKAYWSQVADSATGALMDNFWNGADNYFYMDFVPPASHPGGFQYWPQAHAMDVVIDAYVRTQSEAYLAYYAQWFDGVKQGNQAAYGAASASYRNNFIDDMAWITLTMLRMYETHPNHPAVYLTTAAQIYNDWIITEWTEIPCGGGLKWQHSDGVTSGKNACTNCPAAIIAGRLSGFYKALGDSGKAAHYLADARRIYSWIRSVLYDSQTKILHGGVDVAANGTETRSNLSLSYEVGTALGAAHELYKLTGEQHFLTDAVEMTSKATTDGMPTDNATGCLRSEGQGNEDGGLFKGIFIRYFVKLINDTSVDKAKRRQLYSFMVHNATTLWTSGTNQDGSYASMFGPDWAAPIPQSGAVGLQGHVSGCMLIEAMNVMNPVE
ncbi:MAG: glycosyl hydrolase family 76 [Prevotellaceae bacterium]|jgi:predicted alpha-1,6-mannanase (GH76 family)|nr:glycosyl hydrolase family 76 [Prevotellaceae bacterium]